MPTNSVGASEMFAARSGTSCDLKQEMQREGKRPRGDSNPSPQVRSLEVSSKLAYAGSPEGTLSLMSLTVPPS